MRRIRLVAVASAAAIAGPVLARAADVPRLVDQAIRRLDLQTELPRVAAPEQPFRIQLPVEVLWAVIIVALVVLLYAFRDMIPGFGFGRRGAWADQEDEFGAAAARTPQATLVHADELAARGRFVDAMHALLLQSLAAIRERLNAPFAESLTSREILATAPLTSDGRASLRDIVTRVEWTYFGERPATRADYDACRASFTSLAQALQRSARA